MTTYNKLVRDLVPKALEDSGQTVQAETLNHDRYIIELKKKLNEELMEYQDAGDDEEAMAKLADLLEVIHCLAKVHGGSIEQVEKIRVQQLQEYGGYEEKQFIGDVDQGQGV